MNSSTQFNLRKPGKRLVIIWIALMATPLVQSETPPNLEERGRGGRGANLPQGGSLYIVNTTSDAVIPGACESGGAGCSLRGAIEVANSHPGVDGIDINLPAGSVINLTQALPNLSESVEINGPGASLLTVRRNTAAQYSVFLAIGVQTVTFSGMTISNGNTSAQGGGINGGPGTVVNVNNCTISGNAAQAGGGGVAAFGTLNITNSTISGNTTDSEGGGIVCEGVNVTNSTISGNAAGGNGGGIVGYGEANIISSTINANTADNLGGGIYIPDKGNTYVGNSTISGNSAGSNGGGIFSYSEANIINSTISGNSAASVNGDGGGIFNDTGTLNVTNSTVSGNTATRYGGGIRGNGTTTVKSSIIALNMGASPDVDGLFSSEGFNLVGDNVAATAGFPAGNPNANNDIVGTHASPINPQLDPNGLQNNGGPTRTIALLPGSPAIDKGLTGPLTTDQRGTGFPRTVDNSSVANAAGGDGADIGAVEFGAILIVTTTSDHNDGTCNATDCTLREAITTANALGRDDFITFAPGVTGTIQLSSALPNLSSTIGMQGPGPSLLTVRRNIGGNYRIFTVSNGTTAGPIVRLGGLTIANGAMSGDVGGGIYNYNGRLTLTNCALSSNSALNGGGIYNDGSFGNGNASLTLSRCTLSGNVATSGGGIVNDGSFDGIASLTLSNCTLSGNSASGGGDGGGIYNLGSNGGNASIAITNSTLSGNSASSKGGGIINNGGSDSFFTGVTLFNCTLAGNSAPTGGGIAVVSSDGFASLGLGNTILKTGASGANIANFGGFVTSFGNNLSNDDGAGELTSPGDQTNIEPILGPLTNNGGPQTHALTPASTARDRGNDAYAPPRDQRGYSRVGVSDIGAFEYGGTAPPVQLLSVASRKVHGSAGLFFDINLPATGNPGIECRTGGAGGDYTLIFTFANTLMSVGGVSLTSGTGSVSSRAVGAGAYEYVVNLTGVANAQEITVTLTNVSDSVGGSSPSVQGTMAVLLGDTNANRSVNASDIGQTKGQSGAAVTASNFRTDVNVNGSVNASDIGLVKSRSGTAIP
jgi:CSLREA domain-containing protein